MNFHIRSLSRRGLGKASLWLEPVPPQMSQRDSFWGPGSSPWAVAISPKAAVCAEPWVLFAKIAWLRSADFDHFSPLQIKHMTLYSLIILPWHESLWETSWSQLLLLLLYFLFSLFLNPGSPSWQCHHSEPISTEDSHRHLVSHTWALSKTTSADRTLRSTVNKERKRLPEENETPSFYSFFGNFFAQHLWPNA